MIKGGTGGGTTIGGRGYRGGFWGGYGGGFGGGSSGGDAVAVTAEVRRFSCCRICYFSLVVVVGGASVLEGREDVSDILVQDILVVIVLLLINFCARLYTGGLYSPGGH